MHPFLELALSLRPPQEPTNSTTESHDVEPPPDSDQLPEPQLPQCQPKQHPFFELAFSLRPKEPTNTTDEAPATTPPPTTEQPLNTYTPREHVPHSYKDAPQWRCWKCMPFIKHFPTMEALDEHLVEHKSQRQGRFGSFSKDVSRGGDFGNFRRDVGRWGDRNTPISPTNSSPRSQDAYFFRAEYMRDIGEDTARSPEVPLSVEMIESIDPDIQETQLLILAPTRDAALRAHDIVCSLSESMDITAYPCIGGNVIKIDIMALGDGPHVVSGTLGRVEDMIRRGALRTGHISVLAIVGVDIMFQASTYEQWFDVWSCLNSGVEIVRVGLDMESEEDDV